MLGKLRDGLQELGYEVGQAGGQRISRTVLFNDNGSANVTHELNAFHAGEGIGLQVEAGRGAMSNADYRDLVRASLMEDVRYLVILMPLIYRYAQTRTEAFMRSRNQIQAIYASSRFSLPFKGLLLIGY